MSTSYGRGMMNLINGVDISRWDFDKFTKGMEGENYVAERLRRAGFKLVRNIYIKNEELGRPTEIDILAVSKKGVFCIEVKNVSGIVKGDFKSQFWNLITGTGNSMKIVSPIVQNEIHVGALSEMMKGYSYKNIVIYGRATLDIMLEDDPSRLYVFKVDKFLQAVEQMKNCLTGEEIAKICMYFNKYSDKTLERKMTHKEELSSYTGKSAYEYFLRRHNDELSRC